MDDSRVKLRHKVQLRRKISNQEESSDLNGVDSPNSETSHKSSLRAWVWIFLGVIAACLIAYPFVFEKDSDVIAPSENEAASITESTMTDETASYEEKNIDEVTVSDRDFNNETVHIDKDSGEPEVSITTEHKHTPSSASRNSVNITNDVETEAMKVIRGDYGVGQERKDKLGSQYQPIQNRVNQLKREGAF